MEQTKEKDVFAGFNKERKILHPTDLLYDFKHVDNQDGTLKEADNELIRQGLEEINSQPFDPENAEESKNLKQKKASLLVKYGAQMVEDVSGLANRKLIAAIDQPFPQPMHDETIDWLVQLLRPFFISTMSDPDFLLYSKMLPNPIALSSSEDLRNSNNHTQALMQYNFSNYFSKNEQSEI